jgi:Na+:H+ antiporter, NhaA family
MAQDLKPADLMPRKPIHVIIEPIRHFMHIESASGGCSWRPRPSHWLPRTRRWERLFWGSGSSRSASGSAVFTWSSPCSSGSTAFSWQSFSYVVGLEVKRKLVLGELREFRRAVLPLAAALGGMIVPAAF